MNDWLTSWQGILVLTAVVLLVLAAVHGVMTCWDRWQAKRRGRR